MLELCHSQGLLDRVRAGARKWQMLGVSVGSVAEKCETAVARLGAVLTSLGVDSVNSICVDGDQTRNSLVNREKTSEQRPASFLGARHTIRGFDCRGSENEAIVVG